MAKIIDLSGQKFHRLKVVERGPNKGLQSAWYCICDCGNKTLTEGKNLRGSLVKSCGCLNQEMRKQRMITHGLSKTKTYKIWKSMNQRCENSNRKDFHIYGGRGIKVCERWKNSFENFLSDMGFCHKNLSIDRINNEKGYEPANCAWRSTKEQNNNTRSNIFIEYQGKTRTIFQWAEEFGIPKHTFWQRLQRYGYTFEQAINGKKI
jgi:hypothetical protein